ncbi:hypothetical protein FA10DRAFT_291900 [Acaromyces ingoldii]|uniref:Uncharacterized protein n=1 Tax=Acaromyces ingoldii TaxID=215250 RepID=A0A316YA56_9BASI|nr:hypothetical protein FA10DRAFT_291900 [Acaromyces ingoldii]PWN86566.1 hypothetical protein FA10DRAFT_291900 [Acaromyces ingoldii]
MLHQKVFLGFLGALLASFTTTASTAVPRDSRKLASQAIVNAEASSHEVLDRFEHGFWPGLMKRETNCSLVSAQRQPTHPLQHQAPHRVHAAHRQHEPSPPLPDYIPLHDSSKDSSSDDSFVDIETPVGDRYFLTALRTLGSNHVPSAGSSSTSGHASIAYSSSASGHAFGTHSSSNSEDASDADSSSNSKDASDVHSSSGSNFSSSSAS